jgi:hypothetical protein
MNMNRLKNRLIALFIVFILLPAVIYLAGSIFTFLKTTPSWIYVVFCCIGLITFVFVVKGQAQVNKEHEIKENIDNEAAEEFVRNISTNPIETKTLYVDLKDNFKKYQAAVQTKNLIEEYRRDILEKRKASENVERFRTEVLDLANKLYKKQTVSNKLLNILEEKISLVELEEVPYGIEIYIQKLKEDPEEARKMADELDEALLHNPRLGLELSQKLFNGKAYLREPTLNRITWGSYDIIRENAITEIKERVKKNPELTKKIYYELENALKNNGTDSIIYNLCEKLFGNRYLPIFNLRIVLIESKKYIEEGNNN